MRMNTATDAKPSQSRLSPRLLEKARRLGLQLPVDLERLAIARGCDYYERELGSRSEPLGEVLLSNAELGVALIVSSLPPSPREVRLAAALFGAPDVRADEVAVLAMQENCANVVRYIALCGQRYEPENPLWRELIARLPEASSDFDHLPHPTRFVEMTGIDRQRVGVVTRWIRPRLPAAA